MSARQAKAQVRARTFAPSFTGRCALFSLAPIGGEGRGEGAAFAVQPPFSPSPIPHPLQFGGPPHPDFPSPQGDFISPHSGFLTLPDPASQEISRAESVSGLQRQENTLRRRQNRLRNGQITLRNPENTLRVIENSQRNDEIRVRSHITTLRSHFEAKTVDVSALSSTIGGASVPASRPISNLPSPIS